MATVTTPAGHRMMAKLTLLGHHPEVPNEIVAIMEYAFGALEGFHDAAEEGLIDNKKGVQSGVQDTLTRLADAIDAYLAGKRYSLDD